MFELCQTKKHTPIYFFFFSSLGLLRETASKITGEIQLMFQRVAGGNTEATCRNHASYTSCFPSLLQRNVELAYA